MDSIYYCPKCQKRLDEQMSLHPVEHIWLRCTHCRINAIGRTAGEAMSQLQYEFGPKVEVKFQYERD